MNKFPRRLEQKEEDPFKYKKIICLVEKDKKPKLSCGNVNLFIISFGKFLYDVGFMFNLLKCS